MFLGRKSIFEDLAAVPFAVPSLELSNGGNGKIAAVRDYSTPESIWNRLLSLILFIHKWLEEMKDSEKYIN